MLWKLLRAALQRRPKVELLIERALALREQGHLPDAERVLREAVDKFPRDSIALTNLALVLLEQDQGQQGVALLQRALESDPQCGAAHYNLANVMRGSGRLDAALEHYAAAVAATPRVAPASEELMHTSLEVCDWNRAQVEADKLQALISASLAPQWMRCVSPSSAAYLGLAADSRKQVARYHAEQRAHGINPLPRRNLVAEDAAGRMRIGYLSRDFRDHPVGQLISSAFAAHDRSRFEVFAFSYGPDDGSDSRAEIAANAEHFVDLARDSDEQAASKIAAAGVHVLVDLAGHTTGNRLGVLARRPAPVQVHYLGYPGTTGASYLDYFITDAVATPPRLADEFTERLAFLPNCFMVSGGPRGHAAPDAHRSDHGLPDSAFVFCNFANSSRITREVFDLWMNIMRAVPSAVLWLKQSHALTARNLRDRAQHCAIDPQRLVFAPPLADRRAHLARLALADLALDTIGWYNGHSNTRDMLWAGVPVLTAPGETFASRVAASLLHGAGLSELAVHDASEYLTTGVQLGSDRTLCDALRRKLAANHRSAPFFDARRTVADLEVLYRQMWQSYREKAAD